MSIFHKLSLASLGAAIVALDATLPAAAATFEIAGRFADTSTCTFEGGPQPPTCPIEELEGGSFRGIYDDSGIILPGATGEVEYFDRFGNQASFGDPVFREGSFRVDQQTATLSLVNSFPPVYFSSLTLNFLPPSVPTSELPGAFLNGLYDVQSGASVKTFTSIEVVSATITPISPPASVPEPNTVAGLSVLGLGWLLRKKQIKPAS